MYKNFMQEVAISQISEIHNPNKLSSDAWQLPQKKTTPRGPKQDSPGRLSRDFSKLRLDKIVAGGKGKQYHARQCNMHAACNKILKHDAFVNCTLFHFTKGLGLRNTIQNF
jgi:hypothetical protein